MTAAFDWKPDPENPGVEKTVASVDVNQYQLGRIAKTEAYRVAGQVGNYPHLTIMYNSLGEVLNWHYSATKDRTIPAFGTTQIYQAQKLGRYAIAEALQEMGQEIAGPSAEESDSRRRELDTARIAQMTSNPDEQRILNLLLVEGKELSADTAFRAAIVEKILGLQANTGTNAQIFEKKFVRWHEVLQKANFETTKDNLYVCSRIEKEFGQIKSVLDFKHGYNKIYTQPTNPMDPVKPPNMSHKEWDSYTWAQKSKIAQQYQNSQRPEGYTPTSSSGCLWLTVLLSTSLLATASLAGFGIYQLTIFAIVNFQ